MTRKQARTKRLSPSQILALLDTVYNWGKLDANERAAFLSAVRNRGRLTQKALQRAGLIEASPTSDWHVRPTEAGRAWLAGYLLTRTSAPRTTTR
jgi:hypothetical protein